jgi:hypothetical protein
MCSFEGRVERVRRRRCGLIGARLVMAVSSVARLPSGRSMMGAAVRITLRRMKVNRLLYRLVDRMRSILCSDQELRKSRLQKII